MTSINQDSEKSKSSISAPQISLPKGGGAINGIGEKFSSNPVTGTGSMNVPIPVTSGRSGFGPQLSLSYDSGLGNGPFGFGWNLPLPSITRKTDKGLPRYQDEIGSDIFILSGTEDLVPVLYKNNGKLKKDINHTVISDNYNVQLYRPRIEGLFARIEKWTNKLDPKDCFWRSISKDNIITIYGKTQNSRIYDPNTESHIFSWLISESYDDKGNAILYEYKAEDSDEVKLFQVHEKNRSNKSRSVNRYLKRIKYGNHKPRESDEDLSKRTDWLFELVFDYGEHDLTKPTTSEIHKWLDRKDVFSVYRAGFEMRTYRLCHRVLMFHHFEELGIKDYLVSSMELTYDESLIASFITEIARSGYFLKDGAYLKKSLPSLEFGYSKAEIHEEIGKIDAQSLENLPIGLDGHQYQWVDLDGEGISGILTEQGDVWFYKPNQGNGKFGPLQKILEKPSLGDLNSGKMQFLDLAGDGQLDLVAFSGQTPGFYERTPDQHWEQFKSFNSLPNLNWSDSNLKFTDLNGDGHTDVLIAEENIITWYPSLAEEGFGTEERVFQPFDEELGPIMLFSDGTQSVYLADLSGDGLSDIARIRNGEICYWPNIGYGHFGAKVTMDNSPIFESSELFDQKRVRLADIDGSGTTDIIYLGSDGVDVYFNQAGNSWSSKKTLINFPHIDNITSVMVADLYGNGTACLVWSSSLPQDQGQQMLYIDLMGDKKPHLLELMKNNMGAETIVEYAPSTKFYLKDKAEENSWITKIPFPVHVVERVLTRDLISKNLFITSNEYHHGYFDGVEREFRGFGMVEQLDTVKFGIINEEDPDATNINEDSYVPPVKTKTWFHTGAYIGSENISKHFEDEYYEEPYPPGSTMDEIEERKKSFLLDDTVLPEGLLLKDGKKEDYILSTEEEREACRALKGSILRQEIYALDGTDKEKIPYSVSERNYTTELLQLQDINPHAVFFVHPRETIDYHYERNPSDPRISHQMVLNVDSYGNIERAVNIAYHRFDSPKPEPKQEETHVTLTVNRFANKPDERNWYRVGLPVETRTFEITNHSAKSTEKKLFGFEDTKKLIEGLLSLKRVEPDINKVLPYEKWNWRKDKTLSTDPKLRLIEHVRTLYYNDNLSGPLKLGDINSLSLPYESYKLAFTPELISQIYKHKKEGQEINLLTNYADVFKKGGYLQSNDYKTRNWFPNSDYDDYWWIPSGQTFYSLIPKDLEPPKPPEPVSQDPIYAKNHFYVPQGVRDPFGNITRITYDVYDLMLQKTEDPLDNTVMAVNNYRVMQPFMITDPNDNRTEVKFDIIGMVVGTAVMGKKDENVGDFLDDFVDEFSLDDIKSFIADPRTQAEKLLKNATTRIIYDLERYKRCGQPPFAATLARETHARPQSQSNKLKIQISFTYSDGFGREIQKKIQAEAGEAPQREADIILSTGDYKPGKLILNDNAIKQMPIGHRWVGKGCTIYNNKGKPVKQYEPFFSSTHLYEEEPEMTMTGVTPILFYDPLERVVATLHPNHTYEKVIFDPWQQETWDVNDTLNPMEIFDPSTPNILPDYKFDPVKDPDVGGYFKRLKKEEYLPTWCNVRINPVESSKEWSDPKIRKYEKSAAEKALKHSKTPTIAYLDTLGRVFLTVDNNGKIKDESGIVKEHKYETRLEIDIEGNQREVFDAKNRKVMIYDYDMLGNKIHQSSMEAGERWMLNDVTGNPIRSWDSRGHEFRIEYDDLRRPLCRYVRGSDLQNPDNEILFEKTEYGEGEDGNGQIDAKKLNLRTRVFKQYDGAGIVTNKIYDFKGNLLQSTRELVEDYTKYPNWPKEGKGSLNIQSDDFKSSITYDALNRPVTLTTPDKPNNSIINLKYNDANLLENIEVNIRGSSIASTFINNIDYNAKGQREFIEYGNGVKTAYKYDNKTFRLIQMRTVKGNVSLSGSEEILNASNGALNMPGIELFQDLFYTYDPAGNIISIHDNAQQSIYFKGQVIKPDANYIYDPIYRLIEASGREHIGQASQPQTTWNDEFRVNQAHPSNGQAMRNYTEFYEYDEVGNFNILKHQAANGSWNREYGYKKNSLIEPAKYNNCLTKTTIGSQFGANYTYDAHGNMEFLPKGNLAESNHLREIKWDFKDQMQMVDKGIESKAYYVYDAAGQRVRKVEENGTLKKERIYLGSFEIYREYKINSPDPVLERETLHIMDNKQRIALVETKTIDKTNGNTKDNTIVGESLSRYQLNNHLGSASLELNGSGNIISYEEYYPYGSTSYQAINKDIKSVAKRYRYTGKEKDEETGLYYHGARYYVPWLGRWSNADPIDIKDGTNLYIYVNNRPLNVIDSSGTQGSEPTEPNKSPNFGITIPFDIASRKIGKPSIGINFTGILPSEPKRDPFENMLPLDTKGNLRFRGSVIVLDDPTLHLSDLPEGVRQLVDKVLPDGKVKLKKWGHITTIENLKNAAEHTKPVEAEDNPLEYALPGRALIKGIGKAFVKAGSGLVAGGVRTSTSTLLKSSGEALFVGPYGKSKYANWVKRVINKLTPHHGPPTQVNKLHSIKAGEGITINLPKKIHKLTRSYKKAVDKTVNLRTQLARDVRDIKAIIEKFDWKKNNLTPLDWKDVNAALQELIRQTKLLWQSKGITGYW